MTNIPTALEMAGGKGERRERCVFFLSLSVFTTSTHFINTTTSPYVGHKAVPTKFRRIADSFQFLVTLACLRDFNQVAEVQGQSVRYSRSLELANGC